jgi:hypothetical protein
MRSAGRENIELAKLEIELSQKPLPNPSTIFRLSFVSLNAELSSAVTSAFKIDIQTNLQLAMRKFILGC